MQPRILLSGTWGSRANYEAAVTAAGGTPVSRYLPRSAGPEYDGLILCGGGDMDPRWWGEENTGSRKIDPLRDSAEAQLLCAFLRAGRPILGICRGLQVINVILGGTILQDLPDAARAVHDQRAGRDQSHPTAAVKGTFLHTLYGSRFSVNSAHHQAIGKLAPSLTAAQWSEDGYIEAAFHPALPLWGVQWHPERMCLSHRRPDTVDSMPLMQWFVQQCERAAGEIA